MTDLQISWTDERVELLAKLWGDGLSASQIAAQIGGVSRNAVIGKVHRLGLSGRAKPNGSAPAPERTRSKAPRAPGQTAPQGVPGSDASRILQAVEPPVMLPSAELQPTEVVVVPASERVSIMDLRESMCRWPLGDPTSAEFGYCGTRAITGLPYCHNHARIAYQPAADRKRDRRLAIRA